MAPARFYQRSITEEQHTPAPGAPLNKNSATQGRQHIFHSRTELGLTKIKNVFFVGVTAAIGLFTGLMSPAAAKPGKLTAPVFHGKAPASSTPDAAASAERLHRSANLSYKVAGKRYYPLQKVADFAQEGRASWYGSQFHGRKTSSGERYDMNMMTAAHPTLPIPSYARVINLANGKEVVVRINDRGPFHGNRAIDVSKAAAQKLGFIKAGTARVKIEQVLPGQGQQAAVADATIYVDLQRFDSLKEAQGYLTQTSRHLQQLNSSQKAIMVKQKDGYAVRLGPFRQQERANSMKQAVLTAL